MTEIAELGLHISAWRRHWGQIRASITEMDRHVGILEAKEALSDRDKVFVSQLEKEIERLDEQHRKLHISVLDSIAKDEDGSIEK